jgi:hypothetical protein
MQVPKDERQIAFVETRPRIDESASRQRLDPRCQPVARRTKFRISGVVKGSHRQSLIRR